MGELLESPSYLTWLLGQSVAVVILIAWVITLIRNSRRSSNENQALRERNERLADSLVAVVQSNSRERADERERTLRSTLESLERALLTKRDG